MRTIPKNCLQCQVVFDASLKEHNRGNAKYCSLKCRGLYKTANVTPPEHNCECSTCGTSFYRSPSKQKISKSGYLFCSRICKETAQTIDNPKCIPDIMPSHYRNGNNVSSKSYRTEAFRHKPMVCEDCGFDKVPEVLQIHHVDRNRKNGHISNLKVLCPTCHEVDHFYNKDGRFTVKL